jgi:threonyl-tRNA synthetase
MIAQTIPMSANIVTDSLTLEKIRHSCAHVMAMAVQSLFPETKVTIGPTTESGFYYDFDRSSTFTPEDLGKIEKKMQEIIKANLPIIREVVERAEIQQKLRELGENYKLEILDNIPKNETITRYFIGFPDYQTPAQTQLKPLNCWWDLCAGPLMIHRAIFGSLERFFGIRKL